jgi:hypothetical protein
MEGAPSGATSDCRLLGSDADIFRSASVLPAAAPFDPQNEFQEEPAPPRALDEVMSATKSRVRRPEGARAAPRAALDAPRPHLDDKVLTAERV